MGQLSDTENLPPAPVEHALPWGAVVRGMRWGNGPDLLLLLHEPGADLDAWGSLPGHLASRLPLAVIAYDLPGHGLSDEPWEPELLLDLIRALAGMEWGGRRFVIAAGSVGNEVLALAGQLKLAGAILLSPAVDQSPVRRAPHVPKLFLAGSLTKADITNARSLAASCSGWTVVTSVPAASSGTGMLATEWGARISDQIAVFLRDCLARRANTAGKHASAQARTR